ncbi:hypothetical protein [Phocaeicola sartorii]|uniref:hypothetical protein n=1 Tax=Phocaeicola sartorii TaxID=671267 RepID=UPI0025A937AB|nr:hypothetical protein [Phocaeicola sartorii]
MITIDITSILSQDLKSRSRANDLLLYVQNSGESEVTIDFSNVMFATRSFIDEFYNLFMKDVSSLPFKVEITNVPEDIQAMINSVSKTQTKVKTIRPTSNVAIFENVDDLLKYMKTVAF